MFSKDNIQPNVNPKPLTVQRGKAIGDNISGEVFIRNVSIDPRELIHADVSVRKTFRQTLAELKN